MALHDAEAAEQWWKQALRRGAENANCHLGLGTSQFHQQKIAQAIASYRRALEIDDAMEGAHVSLAVAYLAADCPAQAMVHAEHGLHFAPQNADLLLVKARALIELDRLDDACRELAALNDAGIRPRDVGLLECEISRKRGDFEVALVVSAEICEAFPTLGSALRCFRDTFADFLEFASASRVNAFLTGLDLPPQVTRVAASDNSNPRLPKQSPIDVIIPVHDGLDHLKACLASLEEYRSPLLGQIILVDDHSAPETRRWLNAFARNGQTVQVVHKRTQSGFTRSLARGLALSTSRRFVALNSDSVVGRGWLEKLSAAMPPKSRVAMVGPLSNNAAWQSLGDIFDSSGNYASHPMPTGEDITRTQERLDLIKVFGAPETPLIQGFCVLVDRHSYDVLGGLDGKLFPQGYGEFQDLSLRALDAGYELRIADDCFVGHARGGSISHERRVELSRKARRALYARYTALRYLSAECSAVANRQNAFTRTRYDTMNRYCAGALSAFGTAAKVTCLGETGIDLTGRRVCVFVSYAPDGRLLPYTHHYLATLKAQGFEIVLVLNVDGEHRATDDILELVRIVMLRDNQGFDFGAWRDATARFPSLWDAESILFTNDSIVGPFDGFDRLVTRINETTAPLFYLTESEFAAKHFQSFFWGLKGAGLKNPVVREFFESIKDFNSKIAPIFLYEVFFRQVCETLAGLDSLCLFPMADLSGVDSDIRPTFNPTHHLWRELLQAGFPFLKADFCRKNATGKDAENWLKEIESRGADPMIVRLHVEATRVQRARQ